MMVLEAPDYYIQGIAAGNRRTLAKAITVIESSLAAHQELGRAIVDGLLENTGKLALSYYRAAFISRETMRLGIAVPLHPAAERIYNDLDAGADATR